MLRGLKAHRARGNISNLNYQFKRKEIVAMPRSLPKYQIQLTPEQAQELTTLSRTYTAPFAEVQRARIILLANQGLANAQIARQLGCCLQTVRTWRLRWHNQQTLDDASRCGCPARLSSVERAAITALACSSPQTYHHPWQRWSGEKLAQVAIEHNLVDRISPTTVRRLL